MPTRKTSLRKKRHNKIRSKIKGTKNRPRLVVYRSLIYTYSQLIDDENNVVIAATSDIKSKEKSSKIDKAKKIGTDIAKKAQEKKIAEIVFDRNGYKYHGRVKAVAEGAREGGLKF
ncbi:50S ribosomal protein L18 [Candidatus Peregrinibacteria bacterium]|nr:50S ribosomal protein L18 [Candidatus Peregrinibacteria bacterium]